MTADLQSAVQRALSAWDTTTLKTNGDGMLSEAMESLRAEFDCSVQSPAEGDVDALLAEWLEASGNAFTQLSATISGVRLEDLRQLIRAARANVQPKAAEVDAAPWSKTVESAALLLQRCTGLELQDCENLAGTILGMAANVQPKGTSELEQRKRDYARALDAIKGHAEYISLLEQKLRELQAFKDGVELHQRGGSNSWYWLDDRENYLETMVASLPVVIRAEQLRELLAASQAPAPVDGPRLTAAARVGNTTFSVGVPERMVIEAAQRAASTPTGCLDPDSIVEFRRLLADNAERAAFLDSHPAVSEELSNLIAENEQLREQLAAAQAPAVGAVTAEFLRSLKSAADWSGHPAVNEAHELLSAAPQASAAPVPTEWRKAVQEAYGWLWHINNEPLAPVPLLSEGKASYQARKALRDLLTSTERGEAINAVTATIDSIKAAHPPVQPMGDANG